MQINMIRYFRIKNNLTQQELADKIGCTKQHLGDVERGKHPASEKILLKIADLFEVKVSELYGEKVV